MNPHLNKKQHFKEITFPARIFGYLALCQNIKIKNKTFTNSTIEHQKILPFVSSFTKEVTPEGFIHTNLCFLKY